MRPHISKCILAFFAVVLGGATAQAQSNPVPFLNPIVPSATAPGGPAFTMTVTGAGFVSGATVNWNGSARPTTLVSNSKLTAAISGTDIAAAKTAIITVTNPGPGGGTSNTQYFQVANPLPAQNFTVLSNNVIDSVRDNRLNVLVGDYNGDGKLDVLTVVGPQIWVFPGNGDGSFGSVIVSPGPPSCATSTIPHSHVFQADLNGDGKLDLVIVTCSGTYTALGNGNGTFQPAVLALSATPRWLVIADFNGDGKLDLAYAVFSGFGDPSGIQTQLGKGDGTFQAGPLTVFSAGPNQRLQYALGAGDFNGDGKLDLLVSAMDGTKYGGTVFLLEYLGNGDGSFGSSSQVPGTSHDAIMGIPNVAIGDFNGDGKLDIAYFAVARVNQDFSDDGELETAFFAEDGRDGFGGNLSVTLGNGDGTFRVPFNVLPPNQPNIVIGPVIANDFNQDGKLDLAAGNQMFVGNGDGTFSAAGVASTSIDSVVSGDFNGDGVLDLIAIGSTGKFGSYDLHVLLQIPGPPDFSGGVTPQTQTAVPGGTATYTASHTALNGFTGDVTSTASNLPPGVTAMFNPVVVPGGSGSTTLTLSVANTVPLGRYIITLTGTSGSLSHSTWVELVVNSSLGDFVGSMAGGDSISNITAGQTATYSFQVNSLGGFTGDVALSLDGLPPNSTASFSPATLHLTSGGSAISTLTVVTSASTPVNSYTLTITGTNGPLKHSGFVYLGLAAPGSGDWSGSVTPSSLTITVGGSGSYTINLFGFNGFNSDINLSISGLPAGAQAQYSPAPVIPGGTGSATLTISAPPGTPTGTYQLTSTGSGGGRIRSGVVYLTINPAP